MSKKILFFSIPGLALVLFILSTTLTGASNDFNYVKLEVKGKLLKEGARFIIHSNDAKFAKAEMQVVLERSEDKNRGLDQHLEKLNDQVVIAQGFLDCRRIGQEQGVIYLYLHNQSQVNPADNK